MPIDSMEKNGVAHMSLGDQKSYGRSPSSPGVRYIVTLAPWQQQKQKSLGAFQNIPAALKLLETILGHISGLGVRMYGLFSGLF